MKRAIPIYDICSIDPHVHRDLLIERFGEYLKKHYEHLNRPHRHLFYHLVLFTRGKGTHTIDFQKFSVKPYQIYFMAPGQVHSWHFEGRVDGYIVHFNAELFSSFLQRPEHVQQFVFFNGNSQDGVYNLPSEIQEKIHEIFKSMIEEIDGSKGNIDMIRVLLLQLFLEVEKCCTTSPKKAVPHQKLLLVNHFRQLVDKNFRLLKLPKEYAELMYITPNHLNALCQDVLGKTAGEIIRERLLLEAKRMLTNANMDVNEIAYDLNFQDNSYFTRFFRKNTGSTPEQFRKQISQAT